MSVRRILKNEYWQELEPMLPEYEPGPEGGRPRRDDRQMLEAILWRHRTGSPWRDIPDEFGPWQTVYTRWREWVDDGVFDELLTELLDVLHQDGLLDHTKWLLDSTTSRAQRSAAGAPDASKKTPRRA